MSARQEYKALGVALLPWLRPGLLDARTAGKVRKCRSAIDRIRSMVVIDPETGCHLFTGDCSKNSYALIRVRQDDGRYVSKRAIRIVMEEKLGRPLVANEVVRHVRPGCEKRCCCPDHLAIGTAQENADDRKAHGNSARPRVGKAGAIEIANALLSSAKKGRSLASTVRRLARNYNCTEGTILHIWRGGSYGAATRIVERRAAELHPRKSRRPITAADAKFAQAIV